MRTRAPARVLMYHGVDHVGRERDPHGMFVTPANFRAQMELLLESGFVPVTEDAYLAALGGDRLPRRAVLITFDDGYQGVGEHAAPILESLGIPSVLYVPVGLLGGRADWLGDRLRYPLLSAGEVQGLRTQGMAIGAHGLDHADLTRLGDAELLRQTQETRDTLAELLGTEVPTFAFPYGAHDARVRDAVAAAGYRAAFSVHEAAGRFGIQRVDVNATDTLRTLRVKLHGLYPAARRTSRHVPRARRLVHDLLGSAHDDSGALAVARP
ncbi:polysaccharide deacetylase family protein [Nocardioides nitrophenolicus]|uniref:polysaccharide deacetylase family protein n=1 Tax=Nocardioides nitrophenolicus TaxID=60489 RepID=UPI00195CEFA7|nr:polysaccharide deacetylase family protein [Nocardioides nitrophenolicus]MBM7520310.1 peptidoglycan/xylan/chitin deacetylase (PgdA/CDA1 family) [Nocardioides nitrophenolicus]